MFSRRFHETKYRTLEVLFVAYLCRLTMARKEAATSLRALHIEEHFDTVCICRVCVETTLADNSWGFFL